MLFVTGVRSAGGAAGYFTKDNYYTAEESVLASAWGGAGTTGLGLAGEVSAESFEAVLNGQLPDGTNLSHEGRRAGFDLTFSMPKSWSLIGLVGGETRVLAAYREAVTETMEWAEKNLAGTRVEKDGKIVPEKTGNLIYALFNHDTNREQEPQGHVHVIVANATKGEDGKWRALDAKPLYERHTLLNAISMQRFREKVTELGYESEPGDKYGNFEAKGNSREQIMAFSTRRQQIVEQLELSGLKSGKASDIAALDTRKHKDPDIDRAVLKAQWDAKAAEVNLDLQGVIEAANDRAARGERPFDRIVAGLKGAGEKALAMVAAFKEWIGAPDRNGGWSGGAGSGTGRGGSYKDELMPERPGQLKGGDLAAAVAVGSAIRHLSEREAVFDRNQVYTQALAFGLPARIEQIQARIDTLVEKGLLVAGKGEQAGQLTTASTIRREEMILAEERLGRGAVPAIIGKESAGERLQAKVVESKGPLLNEGQEGAARMILQSQNRIVQVQGDAGVGKSTMLAPLATVLREEGRNVLGLGFQNKMVRDLESGAGIGSVTIAKFIATHESLLDPERTSPERLEMARAMFKDAVVVVDESSMVGNSQQLVLSRLANVLGVARLAIVGDIRQLPAIEAGKPNEMSQRDGAETAHMTENVRAKTETLRRVAKYFQAGRPTAALIALGPNLVEAPDLAGEAAGRYLAIAPDRREDVGIITSGRVYKRAINNLVQQGREAAGELGTGEITLQVLERVNHSREEIYHVGTYKIGQVLDIRRGLDQGRIAAGEAQVVSLDRDKGQVGIIDAKGQQRTIRPEKLPRNLKDDALRIHEEKPLRVIEGDKLRLGENDRKRGLANSDIVKVLGVGKDGITIENAAGVTVTLAAGDPQLRKLDLGYALNAHMAQGVTNRETIAVVDPAERNLATVRLTLVEATRPQEKLTVITTDRDRLMAQLERTPGDKTSALEMLGRLPAPTGEKSNLGRGAPEQAKIPETPIAPRKPPERKIEIGL